MAEQFIGQHLAFLDPGKPSLHYWLREGKSENAEVDYVVAQNGKILPIEVKAGAAGSLKSIHQFCHEKMRDGSAIRPEQAQPFSSRLQDS